MSANSKGTNKKEEQQCRFVVTGFGPFQGVPSNPTSVIAESLVEYLQKQDDDQLQALASNTTTTVLEVSTVAAREFLDGLIKESSSSSSSNNDSSGMTVLLHLGINYRGKGFQLEQCAYNDASFRVPDEQGFQPDKESICKELIWNETLYTPLDVQDLCQKLHPLYPGSDQPIVVAVEEKEKDNTRKDDGGTNSNLRKKPRLEENPKVEDSIKSNDGNDEKKDEQDDNSTNIRIFPSTDPGRFVCNYIYCYSLNNLCRPSPLLPATSVNDDGKEKDSKKEESAPSNNKKSPRNEKYASLFLHVPPVTVVSQEEQLKFVGELMKVIQQQLARGKK